jgi:hypothetical protein
MAIAIGQEGGERPAAGTPAVTPYAGYLNDAPEEQRNIHGRAHALTVLSPMKWWGLPIVWLTMWVLQRFVFLSRPLFDLSFINFAQWSIVRRIPYNGPPAQPERLRYLYNLFETNFNDDWAQYIDAFARCLTPRMILLWGSSFGFPGPLPTEPFRRYIKRNEFIASYYWCAYPDASTTMVVSALEITSRLDELLAQAPDMAAGEFQVAYDAFLTHIQRDL